MIWFIIKWASIVFAVWFLNGLRKVWKNPRFKIIDSAMYNSGLTFMDKKGPEFPAIRLNVFEQEYSPPFRTSRQTYVKIIRRDYNFKDKWTRTTDGHESRFQDLLDRLYALYIQEQKYVEELSK